jgi:hypothetical protein
MIKTIEITGEKRKMGKLFSSFFKGKKIENKELIKDLLFINKFNEKAINELIDSGKKLKHIIKQKNHKKVNYFFEEYL